MLWTKERPWRAAVAPTTRPNAMMPGVTASPRRIPSLKPDHTDLTDSGREAVMAEYRWRRPSEPQQGPGPIRRSLSIRYGVWVPAFAGTTTEDLAWISLAAAERLRPTAAQPADAAYRPAAQQTSAAWWARSPIHVPGACQREDR